MPFWSDPGLEPKRQYKFLLEFPGNVAGLQSFLVKRADKPKFTVNAVQHDFLNHRFYYPGKLAWDPITLTIVDVAKKSANDGNASLALMEAIRKTGYVPPTKAPNLAGAPNDPNAWTLSKDQSVRAGIGDLSIKTLDAKGITVDTWKLKNAFMTSLEFGALDYTVEDLVEITITLQYDWAELTAG